MVTTKELTRYERYFNGVMDALVILKTDLELAERGWTIHVAIDFAELFALAFPLTQTLHLVPQPNEPDTDTYSREQATLAFLFSKWKEQVLTDVQNLILLPPYIEELNTSLRLMKLRRFEAYSWPGIISALHRRAFGDSFAQIRDIVAKYMIEKKVPEKSEERAAIATYIEQEYPDIVSLLATTDIDEGLSVLRVILDMEVILSVQDHFAKYYRVQPVKKLILKDILDGQTVGRNSKEWLVRLNKLRRQRWVANFVDASACAIINSINENLLEHQAVLLIISHSRAVKKVAKDVVLARGAYGDSVANSGVRDLDYLWLYYIHKEDNRKDTLRRVDNTLLLLKQFAILREKLAKNMETSHALLSETEEVLNKLSNLSLSTTTVGPLLKWLDETRTKPSWKYGDSAKIGNAILEMIREGGLAEELITRRDYEQNVFESLIRDMTTKSSGSAAD